MHFVVLIVSYLFLSVFCQIGTKNCLTFEECKGTTQIFDIITCGGVKSCEEANLTVNTEGSCQGSFSCINLAFGYFIRTASGLYSLYNSSFTPYRIGRYWLTFNGEKSCDNCLFETSIYDRGMAVDGYKACSNTHLDIAKRSGGGFSGAFGLFNSSINVTRHCGSPTFDGYYSTYNTIKFNSKKAKTTLKINYFIYFFFFCYVQTSKVLWVTVIKSCECIDVICDGPIECYGFGCSGITNINKLSGCHVKCKASFRNDLCPDGAWNSIVESVTPQNLFQTTYR